MQKNKLNDNNKAHGYWEHYWTNYKLRCKGYYINGKANGYWEFYSYDGDIIEQTFYA